MVTQEESATVSEGEGRGLREKRVERRGVGAETGACEVREVREVGAASNGDSIREPNGGPTLPEELRPALWRVYSLWPHPRRPQTPGGIRGHFHKSPTIHSTQGLR